MANPVWPVSLPQFVDFGGYLERLADNIVSQSMSTGPPKVRRRATAGVKPLNVVVSMTQAQVATLQTFFETTLKDGSLPFDWVHPRTAATTTFMFQPKRPPEFRPEPGANIWRVAMPLIIMP